MKKIIICLALAAPLSSVSASDDQAVQVAAQAMIKFEFAKEVKLCSLVEDPSELLNCVSQNGQQKNKGSNSVVVGFSNLEGCSIDVVVNTDTMIVADMSNWTCN